MELMKKIGLGKRKTDKFTYIFGRLILTFMGVILIPLFLLGISFAEYSKNFMEKDFIEKQEMKCDNMSKTINHWNTQMGIDTIRLSGNPVFNRYLRMTTPGVNLSETYDIAQLFKDFSVKYDFIKSIYFYDKTQNVVFSSLSGVYSLDDFPDTDWTDQLQLQSQLQLLPIRIDASYENSNILMYSPEYVFSWASAYYGDKYLINNISCIKFSKIISDTIVFSDSFMITDHNNHVVLSDRQDLIGKDMDSVYQQFSPEAVGKSGDTYVVTRPVSKQLTAYLMVEHEPLAVTVRYMYTFVYLICTILVLVFICVAYFIAKKVYSPIDEMMKQLSIISTREITPLDSNQIQGELQLFHAVMHTLESQKAHLFSMVSNYEHTVRNAAFSDYINGKKTYEQFTEQIRLLNLDYEKPFCTFLFAPRRHYENRKSEIEIFFHNLDLELTSLSSGIVFEVTPNIYTVILFFSKDEDQRQRETQFLSALSSNVISDYFIATCDGADSMNVFPFVLKKAHFTLNHAIFYDTKMALLRYSEILAPELTDYQLPHSYLNNLAQAVTNGDNEKLNEILISLFTLLQMRQMNYRKCQDVLLSLLFALKKTFQLDSPDLIEQFHGLYTLESAQQFFWNILMDRLLFYKNRDSSPADLCSMIKDYLALHYKENINLVELSSIFQLSYPYLSKLFKENENITLIDYLNAMRIDKAKDLLINSSMPLPGIAEEVGYNNVQSFQRFFKKLEGVTPGAYRQLHC